MLGHLTNFKHKDFFLEITLFDSSVMIVDKTRIGIKMYMGIMII